MLEGLDQGALQAILFHLAYWHVALEFLSRGAHQGWPQCDVGIVLWSLSIAAKDWESRERLTRMCTIPIDSILDTPWDMATYAMDSTILRPLWWFGLLDHRQDDTAENRFDNEHFYRKTPLFDHFLSFDITLETPAGPRH